MKRPTPRWLKSTGGKRNFGPRADSAARVKEAESALGEAVLDGNESAVREVADLRLRVDGFEAGLTALEGRREKAVFEQKRATAADLRRQAAEKRSELEVLNGKTAKLLAKLSELEGIPYEHHILCAQRTPGGWQPQPIAGVYHVEYCDPSEVMHMGIAYPGPYQRGRSRLLFAEAVTLEQNAQAIEDKLFPPPKPQNVGDPAFAELYAPAPKPPDSEYGAKAGPFYKAPPLSMR